jgi:hypothetical protein
MQKFARRSQAIKVGQAGRLPKWDNAYSFFVGLYETRELGGGRFLARRERG